MSLAPTRRPTAEPAVSGHRPGSAAPGSAASVVGAIHRSALLWVVPVGLTTVTVLGVLRGPAGAGAAAIGGGIALVAFLSGTWGVGWLLDHLPGAEVPAALALYLIQLLLLVSVVLVVRDQPWLDARAAAVGLFATALGYQVGQVLGFLRSRTLVVDPPMPGGPLP